MALPFRVIFPMLSPELGTLLPQGIEIVCSRGQPSESEFGKAARFSKLTDPERPVHVQSSYRISSIYQRTTGNNVVAGLTSPANHQPVFWVRTEAGNVNGASWTLAGLLALALANLTDSSRFSLPGLRANEQIWCTGTLSEQGVASVSAGALDDRESLHLKWAAFCEAPETVARFFVAPEGVVKILASHAPKILLLREFEQYLHLPFFRSKNSSGKFLVSVADSAVELRLLLDILTNPEFRAARERTRRNAVRGMTALASAAAVTAVALLVRGWTASSSGSVIANAGADAASDARVAWLGCVSPAGGRVDHGGSFQPTPCTRCECSDGDARCESTCVPSAEIVCDHPRTPGATLRASAGWVGLPGCVQVRCTATGIERRHVAGCGSGPVPPRVPTIERDSGRGSARDERERVLIARLTETARRASGTLDLDPDDISAFRTVFSSTNFNEAVELRSVPAASILQRAMRNFSTRECRYWMPRGDSSFWVIYQRRAELYGVLGMSDADSGIRRCTRDMVNDNPR